MSLAATFLSTLALAVIFWNRGPGFDKIFIFLYACIAYGFIWISAAFLLYQLRPATPLLCLALLHAACGAIGILGVIGITDYRDAWWVWPAAAVTLGYPLLLCALRLWP